MASTGLYIFRPSRSSLLFFFFQAEDGIRDGRVTGVQTCALPIWHKAISINSKDMRIACVTQPRSVCRNGFQHRPYVRRRTGDDTEDLARRSLLLQRLFEFVEQPHVLDCDNCLIGKSLKEIYLRRCKGTHLGPARDKNSNEFSLL